VEVGDLVRVIKSVEDDLWPSYLGRLGIIIEVLPLEYNDADWYSVAIVDGRTMKFRYDYLEAVSEAEKGNNSQATS